jgi:hypothetical protein
MFNKYPLTVNAPIAGVIDAPMDEGNLHSLNNSLIFPQDIFYPNLL